MPDQADTPEPASPATTHPRHQRLLNEEQHKFAFRLYVGSQIATRFVTAELNKKFNTSFKSSQIAEYIRARKWTARKRRIAEVVLPVATHELVKAHKQEIVSQHKEFLAKSAEIGTKIMHKAESIIERAIDARTLSSAAAAAKTGIEIYRKTHGLDSESAAAGAARGGHTFQFNFARGPGSPFAPKQVAEVVEAAVAALPDAPAVEAHDDAP